MWGSRWRRGSGPRGGADEQRGSRPRGGAGEQRGAGAGEAWWPAPARVRRGCRRGEAVEQKRRGGDDAVGMQRGTEGLVGKTRRVVFKNRRRVIYFVPEGVYG
jgi:hypothetical protein